MNFNRLKHYTDIGDLRLNKRYSKLCNALAPNLAGSIPAAHSNKHQSKAAYRFFDNDKVTPDKLIEGHRSAHLSELGTTRLLVHQDTTGLVYTGKKGAVVLGPLNYENNRGFYLHNSLVSSAKGVPIGLFKQTYVERTLSKLGGGPGRRNLPIEEKETYRWLAHFRAVQDGFGGHPGVEVIDVADREADFYELLAAYDPVKAPNVHYLIRSKHNRRLAGTEDRTIRDRLGDSPVRGKCRTKVTNRKTAKKRTATLEVKYEKITVQLHRPMSGKRSLEPISLWVIEAKEPNPPKGVKPANWILLTSLTVKNLTVAKQHIRYYALRWLVERFHYILKQGAKVENLQLEKPHRLKNAVSLYSVIAVNIMKMNYLARKHPLMPIHEAGITQLEYEALYKYFHHHVDKRVEFDAHEPPNLEQFIIKIAELGGFVQSKRQSQPGLKTTWRGMKKFELIFNTYSMSKNS